MRDSGLAKSEQPPVRPFRLEGKRLTLTLRVQPGAGATEPAGRYGGHALRLRLAAPARDGKANRACIAFLAEALGVAPAVVSILHGAGARDKVVRIDPVEPERARQFLARWIG